MPLATSLAAACRAAPDELKPYTLCMKLYFEMEQKEKFFEVLDKLRASSIVIDNQTLELIRIVQR